MLDAWRSNLSLLESSHTWYEARTHGGVTSRLGTFAYKGLPALAWPPCIWAPHNVWGLPPWVPHHVSVSPQSPNFKSRLVPSSMQKYDHRLLLFEGFGTDDRSIRFGCPHKTDSEIVMVDLAF